MPAVPLCVGCDQASEPRPASADTALSCVGPGLWLRTAARRRHQHCAAPTLCVGCSRYPRAPRHCSLVWAKVAGCEQPPDATLPGTVPPGAVPPSLPGVASRGPRRLASGGRPAGSAGSPPPETENPPRSLLAAHWRTLDARLSARRSAETASRSGAAPYGRNAPPRAALCHLPLRSAGCDAACMLPAAARSRVLVRCRDAPPGPGALYAAVRRALPGVQACCPPSLAAASPARRVLLVLSLADAPQRAALCPTRLSARAVCGRRSLPDPRAPRCCLPELRVGGGHFRSRELCTS